MYHEKMRIFFGVQAVSLAFLVTGCLQGDPSVDPYRCLNQDQLPQNGKDIEQVGRVSSALATSSKVFWRRPDYSIPICWDPTTYKDEDQIYRDLVQQTVADTWGKALAFDRVDPAKQYHFTGWQKCGDSDTESARISTLDSETHTTHLGSALAGATGGVNLNFAFGNWSPGCAKSEEIRKKCILDGAVHEFGHVLGATHEQNRPDKDQSACEVSPDPNKGATVGTVGDLLFGPWDLSSVMNYCNPIVNNGGILSPGDELGIRAAYYPELFNFQCLETVKSQAKSQAEFNARTSPKVDSEQTMKAQNLPTVSKPRDLKSPAGKQVK